MRTCVRTIHISHDLTVSGENARVFFALRLDFPDQENGFTHVIMMEWNNTRYYSSFPEDIKRQSNFRGRQTGETIQSQTTRVFPV